MAKLSASVDAGYAWVILAGVFGVLVMSAITFVNGVFNVSFLEEFGRSHALTSWCFALQLGFGNVSGLIGSVIAHRYGTRLTVMLGGLCLALGVFLTALSTSLTQVFISYGVLAGMGVGLTYTPASVILGFYFNQYRNIAYGFVTTGVGFGVMLFGPLVNYLIVLYTWRGAMLVLSAILANNIVFGALMMPQGSDTAQQLPDDIGHRKGIEMKKQSDDTYRNSGGGENRRKSMSVRNLHNNEHILNQAKTCSLRSGLDLTSSFRDLLNVPTCHLSAVCLAASSMGTEANESTDQCKSQLNHTDISASLYKSNGDLNDIEVKELKSRFWCLTPCFVAHVFNFFSVGIGLSCIYIHLPAYVIQLGTSASHASILLSLMGCGNIIGRLGIGAITNRWKKQTMGIYIGTCVISGLCALFGPLICKYFIGQVIFSVCFMMLGNCYISVMAPICIGTVGLENLNIAFGISICFNGCGFLIGPTMAGWLLDITGSYFYTFILTGVCFLTGSLVITLATLLRHVRNVKS